MTIPNPNRGLPKSIYTPRIGTTEKYDKTTQKRQQQKTKNKNSYGKPLDGLEQHQHPTYT